MYYLNNFKVVAEMLTTFWVRLFASNPKKENGYNIIDLDQ